MTAVSETSAQPNSSEASEDEFDRAPAIPRLPSVVIRRSRSESQLSFRIAEDNTYANLTITPKEAFRLWGVTLDSTLLNEGETVVTFKS